MRFFFLVIFLAGLALGVGYPWAVKNASGYEIGTFLVLDGDDGYTPAEVELAPSEAPVLIELEMHTAAPYRTTEGTAALTMTVVTDGRTILVAPISFANAEARSASPQGGMIYRADVAAIDPIDGDDDYVFTVEPGQARDLELERAELILTAGAFELDSRAVPTGYMLIAVGLLGFLAMSYRRRLLNRKREAEDPKWGRGPDEPG